VEERQKLEKSEMFFCHHNTGGAMLEISNRLKRIQGSERAERKIVIPTGTIRFDSGEPNFSTPLHIQEAATKAMRNGFTHYLPAYGDEALREAIVASLKEDYSVDRKAEDILVTVGGSEAIYLLAAAYINPGDEAVVLDPDYSAYVEAVRLFGGDAIPAPVGTDLHIDLEEINRRVTPKTKMIFLSNPCNPTGMVYTEAAVRGLAIIAQKNNLILVVDEVYHKLLYDGARHFSVCQVNEAKNHTVLVNSFSKTYAMTGWRIGYLVANAEIVKTLAGLHKSLLICANAHTQKACLAALTGPQTCVDLMKEEYSKRRKLSLALLSEIDGLSVLPCQGAFYLFPRFDHAFSSRELTTLLSEKKLLVRSGTEFGQNGEKHFRITFATSVENIEKGLDRLKKVLKELE
jgi:aspartate/methionine/tyrosine aminotransferase